MVLTNECMKCPYLKDIWKGKRVQYRCFYDRYVPLIKKLKECPKKSADSIKETFKIV